MRVFFASDLHFDAEPGASVVVEMANYLRQTATPDDVLVLGGDYANDDQTLLECLELFEAYPGPKLAIAGNHDVWQPIDEATSSLERYAGLSALFERAGFHPLEDDPVVVNGVGFAGAMGWYDYSFREPTLDVPLAVYQDKRLPQSSEPVWNDARYVDWGRTDPEVTEWQLTRLRKQLDQLSEADKIIVVTHHVPTSGLLRPRWLPTFVPRRLVVPQKWLILNTYLGSRRFGDLLTEYDDQIDVALCGHIHLGRKTVQDGIVFISNGSNYRRKELLIYNEGRITRRRFGTYG